MRHCLSPLMRFRLYMLFYWVVRPLSNITSLSSAFVSFPTWRQVYRWWVSFHTICMRRLINPNSVVRLWRLRRLPNPRPLLLFRAASRQSMRGRGLNLIFSPRSLMRILSTRETIIECLGRRIQTAMWIETYRKMRARMTIPSLPPLVWRSQGLLGLLIWWMRYLKSIAMFLTPNWEWNLRTCLHLTLRSMSRNGIAPRTRDVHVISLLRVNRRYVVTWINYLNVGRSHLYYMRRLTLRCCWLRNLILTRSG